MQTVTPIAQAGSNRVYTRVTREDGSTYIHVEGTNRTENHAFITMARHFEQLGLPTPRLYAMADDEMSYDQQDLGDIVLFDHLDRIDWLEATMRALRQMHDHAAEGFDFSVCFPVPALDERSVRWDLNYFKYCFLKLRGLEIDEPALEDDFDRMVSRLLAADCSVLMLRDCQSRNVMISDGQPYFIDFQGGRRGLRQYDIASFLWQAKAGFSPEQRAHLIDVYLAAGDTAIDREDFLALLPHVVLFRTLQVLGAYGFRGLHEGRPHFVQSIPMAIQNLRDLFAANPTLKNDYPYVDRISLLL